MGDLGDRESGDSRDGQERGASFDQRQQHVYGPQYNADRISIGGSVSPDDIAEGLRRDRERTAREKEEAARLRREQAEAARRERERERQEESDLKLYGYRYYTPDRNRWLQSLPGRQRWDEQRRQSARTKHGTMPWQHHQRILRAGKLPSDTSPADPRYLQAKKKVEGKEKKRELRSVTVVLVIMITLNAVAVLDGAIWFVVLCGIAAVGGVVTAVVKGKS